MHDGLSISQLIIQASLPVQFLMLVLALMVVVTLFITGKKWVQFSRLDKKRKNFLQSFWHAKDLRVLYEHYHGKDTEGLESLFIAGFQEFLLFRVKGLSTQPTIMVNNCRRAMEAALIRENAQQERLLTVLATFASSAPYIGLLGTVYGIMTSFIALGASNQQANIASVAPGIAEALIATAIGLIAAIPSVLVYNFFIDKSDKLSVEYEAFIEEFVNIFQRQVIDNITQKSKRDSS